MVVTRSKAKLQAVATSNYSTTSEGIPIRVRPYPDKSPKTIKKVKKTTQKKSFHFSPAASIEIEPTIFRRPPEGEPYFGLIQESLRHSLYALCVQACLWNQTRGQQARPVLAQILTLYPAPEDLAAADLPTLTALLYPIGLHNIRAARLIAFAKTWVADPPCKERRHRKIDYPRKGDGKDIKKGEVLDEDDEREGWEVGHLPGVGAYAMDSYRIFYRDRLRGLEGKVDGREEWRRVVPLDKDLRAYLVWRWRQEGWEWDMLTGKRRPIEEKDQRSVEGE